KIVGSRLLIARPGGITAFNPDTLDQTAEYPMPEALLQSFSVDIGPPVRVAMWIRTSNPTNRFVFLDPETMKEVSLFSFFDLKWVLRFSQIEHVPLALHGLPSPQVVPMHTSSSALLSPLQTFNGQFAVWERRTGALLRRYRRHLYGIVPNAFFIDGNLLVYGD